MHNTTKLWQFGLKWSSKLQENNDRKNTLVAQLIICVLSDAYEWEFEWEITSFSKTIRYFRGSHFSQCFITLSTVLHCMLPSKFLCSKLIWVLVPIVSSAFKFHFAFWLEEYIVQPFINNSYYLTIWLVTSCFFLTCFLPSNKTLTCKGGCVFVSTLASSPHLQRTITYKIVSTRFLVMLPGPKADPVVVPLPLGTLDTMALFTLTNSSSTNCLPQHWLDIDPGRYSLQKTSLW